MAQAISKVHLHQDCQCDSWLAQVDEQEDVFYWYANTNNKGKSDDEIGGRMDDDKYIDRMVFSGCVVGCMNLFFSN